MSTALAPLPIWSNSAVDAHMENVGAAWKTPEKIEEYTRAGCERGFPDSYRVVDQGGPGFGFRAGPATILTGNWRLVLTRRISDVLGEVVKRLDERNYDPCPPVPLTRLSIHGRHEDRPWLGSDFIAKFNPDFVKAMGWSSKGDFDCGLHMRVYPPTNGWAVVSPRDVRSAGTCAIFCAVPRDEAIAWVKAQTNLEV